MYVDLVICKHDGNPAKYLFVAPPFSHLVKDDKVIVDTQYGTAQATVIDSITVCPKSDEYRFILNGTGATEPLRKVVSKIVYRDFEYEDETEESENAGIDKD